MNVGFSAVIRKLSGSVVINGKMPKPKGQKSKGGKNEEKAVKENEGPISLDKGGNISIKILAKPGTKQNNITDIQEDGVGVQIAAPPVEGEANTELVKYLASVFGLRKSEVTLDKGSKSRQKVVLLQSGSIGIADVIKKLQAEVDNN